MCAYIQMDMHKCIALDTEACSSRSATGVQGSLIAHSCREPIASVPAVQHNPVASPCLQAALPALSAVGPKSRRLGCPGAVQGAKRKRACPATDACDSEDDLRIRPGCGQDKSSHQPNCDIIMFDDVRVSPPQCDR